MSTGLSNLPLAKPLRSHLENTVKAARDVAEKGAKAALAQLAVGEAKVPDYLIGDDQKSLRRRLRAHGRALGDVKAKDDTQGTQHLMWEVAYEHWHRMLFARFLAENGLLMWEPGAPVSLDDCRDMVGHHPEMAMGAKSHWELAGKLAARMLPQVFKPQSPVFELTFAPEHQRELERLLAALAGEVFKASDSLGWVYQFWQAKRKDEVNASEVKIGADELPAVTQLFTEPYMVDFLLHNSLGAWWVTRHPGRTCPVPLTYLRTLEDGTPAAGKFEGWPNSLSEFKLLDPCCGSGHFQVAAFLMLVPMRMEAEGLSAMDAVDAVLADNLHGLEIDARCVEIAVFALALAAWRFTDENGDPLGVRADMPAPQIACCGLKVATKPEDWMALVPNDAPNAQLLRQELRLLHASFAQAPLLGSLLDPARSLKNDLATSSFETLRDLMGRALASERPATLWGQSSELQDDSWDLTLTAKGLLDAARLIDGRYHLVVTNVPYLGRGLQEEQLRDYCEGNYPAAKSDLACVFLMRCLELAHCDELGLVQVVLPQNWLHQKSYTDLRKEVLKCFSINLIAKLGEHAFESSAAAGALAAMVTISRKSPILGQRFFSLNVSAPRGKAPIYAHEKAKLLRTAELTEFDQSRQLDESTARILVELDDRLLPLSAYAEALHGQAAGDNTLFNRQFWEVSDFGSDWELYQGPPEATQAFSGRDSIVYWQDERGTMARLAESVKHLNHKAQQWRSGKPNWKKRGVAVNLVGRINATLYTGEIYSQSCCVIVPKVESHLKALWAFAASGELESCLREIDPGIAVSVKTVIAVPFDIERWEALSQNLETGTSVSPYADDPTQWLFHGHPQKSTDPLQVAVARLVGYRWPAETHTSMELADEARTWIALCDQLAEHTDDDGILCLPSVRGEPPAHDRLLKLLISAWETVQPGSWKPAVLDKLLADADCAGKGLDVWLRDKFFEQHAKRFHHRPFIWHVWDGLKDGFAALVNYHKLDAKNLERLIHTYLGRWISDQEDGVRNGVDGAPTRLAAAQDLKRRLELILEGEKPYDIFVRWKPPARQPVGWNPDLNEGVRLNIRPFMTAGVLRHNKKPKLNITWDKDRGKDVESAPWFKTFNGERINDHHLTLAEKRAARSSP